MVNPNIRIFDNNIVTINRDNYISAMKLSSEFPDDYAYYDDVMLFTKLFSPTQPQNIEFTNNNIDIEMNEHKAYRLHNKFFKYVFLYQNKNIII